MASEMYSLPGRDSVEAISHSIDRTREESVRRIVLTGDFDGPVTKKVTSTTQLLLAVGGANLPTRKKLIVKNVGKGIIMLGKKETTPSYKHGLPLDPGQTLEIEFSGEPAASKDIYAWAKTIASDVEIMEV